MITDELFEKVLLNPVHQGANNLYVVSGYASATMASYHLERLLEISKNVTINLIVGMASHEGISKSNHQLFKTLMGNIYPQNFDCRYITDNRLQVHSKVYTWCKDDTPLYAFVGSANYTNNGFLVATRQEAMGECSAVSSLAYFRQLINNSTECNNIAIEDFVTIYLDRPYSHSKKPKLKSTTTDVTNNQINLVDLSHVKIDLLSDGTLPQRSGLNWGQRPKRDSNQAYIKIPSDIYKTDFFPERKIHFSVLTDDNQTLICTRAQDNGKAIHTPFDNSLLGRYFRKRLGLSSGVLVTEEDLLRYGRTDIDFYKITDDTYFMDFSVSNKNP